MAAAAVEVEKEDEDEEEMEKEGGDGVGWCGTVRVHVSRSFFSDYPTGASLIRVSTFFAVLPFFSPGVQEGFFVCDGFSRKSGEPREKIVAIVARSGQRSL